MSQRKKKEYKAITSPRAVSAISSLPYDRETPFTRLLLSCAAQGGRVAPVRGYGDSFPVQAILLAAGSQESLHQREVLFGRIFTQTEMQAARLGSGTSLSGVHEASAKKENRSTLQLPQMQGRLWGSPAPGALLKSAALSGAIPLKPVTPPRSLSTMQGSFRSIS